MHMNWSIEYRGAQGAAAVRAVVVEGVELAIDIPQRELAAADFDGASLAGGEAGGLGEKILRLARARGAHHAVAEMRKEVGEKARDRGTVAEQVVDDRERVGVELRGAVPGDPLGVLEEAAGGDEPPERFGVLAVLELRRPLSVMPLPEIELRGRSAAGRGVDQ